MRRRSVVIAGFGLCITGLLYFIPSRPHKDVLAARSPAIGYDRDGNLVQPANYREWTYLTTGIDMSYTSTASPAHSMFDSVFVNTEAYQSFQKTGTWPDKTIMVLEVREAKDRGSINLRGHYQGTEVMGLEAHVKDEARFPGKWAFFEMDLSKEMGTRLPQTANCYSCHAEHGAVDTTFVQFYPTLLPIAKRKGTLSDPYLRESAAPAN